MPARSGKTIRRKLPAEASGAKDQEKPKGLWDRVKEFIFGGGERKPPKRTELPPMKKPKGDYWKPSKDTSDIPPL